MPRKPYVFIGSSAEGLKYAEALQLNLDSACETHIWSQGLFGLSDGTFDRLFQSLDQFDFAVLILTGDDLTFSRDVEYKSPRDNVIFELGLFMGGLGKNRVYIIADNSVKPKLPSDLSGITLSCFDPPKMGTAQTAMGPSATRIKVQIEKNGLRDVVKGSQNNYDNDLKMIMSYANDKNIEFVSIDTLIKNVNPKFEKDYVMKIIEANPSKIRYAKLKGDRPGIKILDGDSLHKLIWQDKFDNINHWYMNYWGSLDETKTNRIEKSLMIFEAEKSELKDSSGCFGAFVDLTSDIIEGTTYLVQCKVKAIEYTSMGFQLWIHNGTTGQNSIFRPVMFQTPSIKFSTISASYTATDSNAMRIHLHCKGGSGRIEVGRVAVFKI